MFESVFESLKSATETTVKMQQEMFKKWASQWPGLPAPPQNWNEQVQKYQKKWTECVDETLKKQREALEAQFKVGLTHIEEAFRLGEAKDIEQLHAKTLELWQKTFDALRQIYEALVHDFQAMAGKWTDLVSKGAA
jgi:hypothetical protein